MSGIQYEFLHQGISLLIQPRNFSEVAAAATAAKSLQSCPTLCDPMDSSPPGSTIPGILQARTLEWVAISFSNAWKWKVKVKSLSRVLLLATPWTPAYQAPPSMGFSRQEYWSGVPFSLVNQTPRAVLVGATSRSRVHMTPTENLQAEAIQTYLHFFFFFFRNLVYFPHLFQKYSSYIKSSAVT